MRNKILMAAAVMLAIALTALGYRHLRSHPVAGPFSASELQRFTALQPIDAHTHILIPTPEFRAVMTRLNLHVLDILVLDDTNIHRNNLAKERADAQEFARATQGRTSICTTFSPFLIDTPGFEQTTIQQLDRDFDQGAIAVKIWKNIGMELEDPTGKYILPDDPAFQPIYQDIAAHNKTLIAHIADPRASWEPPNPKSLAYTYYQENPQWYMYGKPNAPYKESLLKAFDHVLEENPNLRVVGAHLGSMEDDLQQLGDRLDRYPNLAVDLAARMPYLMSRPRSEIIAFFTRYQDRLIYGTDLELGFGENENAQRVPEVEANYARIWRFLATSDTLSFRGGTIQGLNLPPSILRKLYRENAVHWYPGIAPKPL